MVADVLIRICFCEPGILFDKADLLMIYLALSSALAFELTPSSLLSINLFLLMRRLSRLPLAVKKLTLKFEGMCSVRPR